MMTLKVAIPDTSLTDCTDLRQKTVKVGQIARTMTIFRVEEIIIYATGKIPSRQKRDVELIQKILRFMDTPQYLRRRAFPQSSALRYAGLLPPLRSRSHPLQSKLSDLEVGMLRWGIQVRPGKIDLGFDELIDFPTTMSERDPSLFRVESISPTLSFSVIDRSSASIYWGFEVYHAPDLVTVLKDSISMTRIGFSRKAPSIASLEKDLKSTIANTGSVLAVFGGPTSGILEIFDSQRDDVKQHIDFWVNAIEDQGSETVRLEEALLVCLGLLNSIVGKNITRPGFYE